MTKFNRRHFMAGSGALMGSSMLSAPNLSFAGGHLAAQELRTVGLSVTVQERILNDFKASSGIGGVSGKADIYPNTQTELLSGSKAYDCWETIGERLPAMTMTNTIEPIPTSKLSSTIERSLMIGFPARAFITEGISLKESVISIIFFRCSRLPGSFNQHKTI